MSQSDYIKYKKINTVLQVDANDNFLPVLNSQEYSDYKEHVLENTIANSKTIYRRITPSTTQVVLDMDKNKSLVQNMGTYSSDETIPIDSIIGLTGMNGPQGQEEPTGPQGVNVNCPSFIMCNGTNNRPYRVPMSDVYFTPTPQPLHR